ncbi:hypothetical protein PUNSTDRAFT_120903 [Punctularia strigosozonata HHB-11173 SS5]|uniref:uncharacterized protein n=1 Tax=Punctularia strigosozonata (strain HHB-11173) TaxID=741275 RepID=UPI00044172FB|nr:uncharacterized protein PUNSTDRAFT_120903 [Punctularia strigosozonata HHB-11173 SS5]EIN08685.1 hypothetical protein PUNSTDRAFT_120903 [Punctularia strigosozonata HHB-11173 SS5]
MPREFFTFLSACESAAGDEGLPDEIVHLTGSMLFAGLKSGGNHVGNVRLGGASEAKEVHEALLKGEYEDPGMIPRALDSAIRKLRERATSGALGHLICVWVFEGAEVVFDE